MVVLRSIKDKHGEMPWWLILMILAIVFLAIMSYVSGGLVKKTFSTVGGVQDKTASEADCIALFGSNDADGDGYIDGCISTSTDSTS